MANNRHVEVLRSGAGAWNLWLATERLKDYTFRPDLSGADLGCLQLQHVDLSRADLVGADLAGACLRHANLTLASLDRASLAGAELRAADLWYASIDGADFVDADLFHAAFGSDRTDLSLAGLAGTKHEARRMNGTTVGFDTLLKTVAGLKLRPDRRDEVQAFLVRCGVPEWVLDLL